MSLPGTSNVADGSLRCLLPFVPFASTSWRCRRAMRAGDPCRTFGPRIIEAFRSGMRGSANVYMQKDMLLRSNFARFDACGIAQATRDRSRDALSFSSAFIVADAPTHSPIVRSLRCMVQTRPHVSRSPGVAICAMHRRDDRVTVRRAAVRRRDHVDGIAVGQGMHGHLHSARSKKRIRKSKGMLKSTLIKFTAMMSLQRRRWGALADLPSGRHERPAAQTCVHDTGRTVG